MNHLRISFGCHNPEKHYFGPPSEDCVCVYAVSITPWDCRTQTMLMCEVVLTHVDYSIAGLAGAHRTAGA